MPISGSIPCLILAAGRGERMRPLTDFLPKPLLEVQGKSLLTWHLENLQVSDIQHVVINLAWLGEKISAALGSGIRFGLHIDYSPENEALETAGGICQALPILNPEDYFIVINGDIFCPNFPIRHLVAVLAQMRLASSRKLAHLILVPNPSQHPDGDFYLQGDLVWADEATKMVMSNGLNQTAKLSLNVERLTFSGIGIYHQELFKDLVPGEKVKLAPLLISAMAKNQVTGEKYLGSWHDVGSPERLIKLNQAINNP
ncbi:MAG: nucleotidyltransferase family protein [Burkholderiales bacterium]|nr:nucleotidyltransferase family protein [Burkholderiales bacterium]